MDKLNEKSARHYKITEDGIFHMIQAKRQQMAVHQTNEDYDSRLF
jgi:hypothetical protein